ncbi:FISUMP domain-containing protein [uncultured Psychroserpens sp.]|uniref:FISUMP domain-containing protein n=1 Tax=uncultured Psychroserpens sp. TaxID=255436 RepID=UPI0026277A21|nr:FISUMP domain-containing protein [uncultured Psychroserpens sp.]
MKWINTFFIVIVFLLVIKLKVSASDIVEDEVIVELKVPTKTNFYLDTRNDKKYELIKIDKLWWFNQDLDFKTPTSDYFDSKNEAFSKSRLYYYEDAVKVCPKGWRLPNLKEFDVFLNQISEEEVHGIAELNYNWDNINKEHPKGFKFRKTGFLHKKKKLSKSSFNMWIFNDNSEDAYHAHMYESDKGNLQLFRHTHTHKKPKKNRRFAVRCVCEDSNFEPK